MQVSCFGFDWDEVLKRPSAEAIAEEMILTDDIDTYATYLPEDLWRIDSAALHFEIAEVLSELTEMVDPNTYGALSEISKLICEGDAIDELGLNSLTEGSYFISLSPDRTAPLAQAFSSVDFGELENLYRSKKSSVPQGFASYLTQWQSALSFVQERGLGLVGHCG